MLDKWVHESKYLPEFTASIDLRNQRIEICESCDRLNSIKVCKQCNCFMPLKTWLKTKKCPQDKW